MFISGTQPVEPCHLHGGGKTEVASWDTPAPAAVPATPETRYPSASTPAPSSPKQSARSIPISPTNPDSPDGQQPEKKKKGFFGRLRDVFRDPKPKDDNKDK